MNVPKKLRGNAVNPSELTKLKALWRGKLSEEQKAQFNSWFAEAGTTQAMIRASIKQRYGISLLYDGQLSVFRDWQFAQAEADLLNERMEQRERELREEHPEWTLEQLRQETLRVSYTKSLATGDMNLGLKTVAKDLSNENSHLERTKFAESLKTKIDAGLDALYDSIKGNKEAEALIEQLRGVVKKAAETK